MSDMRFGRVIVSILLGCPASLLADAVLRGRVVDAETGRPVACTVTVSAAGGKVFADHRAFAGAFARKAISKSGSRRANCTSRSLAGSIIRAVERNIEARDGEAAVLDIRLERRTPLPNWGG